MIARPLTYYAARQKDSGRRCDLEAGMGETARARIAWSNADNAVQIHGGNGFAMEFPISRILCDARILSIFEGRRKSRRRLSRRRCSTAPIRADSSQGPTDRAGQQFEFVINARLPDTRPCRTATLQPRRPDFRRPFR